MDSTAVHQLIDELRELKTDHSHVEAKRAKGGMPKDLWPTVVAFANGRGGVVLLGVNEKSGFTVTGVDDPGWLESRVSELCSTEIEPPVRATITSHEIDGGWVVTAAIPPVDPMLGPSYYRPKGLPAGALIRIGDSNRQLTSYEVHLLLSRRSQTHEELRPMPEATSADLDGDAVDDYLKRMRRTRPRAFADRADTEILQMTNILVRDQAGLVPSLAGLLSFANFPQQFLPQVNATFVAYPEARRGVPGPSGERFLDNATFDGPIPVIVDDALRRLRSNMRRAAVVRDVGRTDVWEYPIPALREAIVNSLVHRDFSTGALGTQVQIELYPDRLTIRNPGGLYGPVDPSHLLDLPVSATRNPTLLRILEDVPLAEGGMVCENRGSGLAVMAESLRQHRHPAPEFADSIAVFEVTFRPAHSQTAAVPATAHDTSSTTDTMIDPATVRIVAELRHGPLSRRALAERTGLAPHVVRYRLDKLRKSGAVRLIGVPRDPHGRWEIVSE